MLHDFAVEHGLAVLVVPDGDVELARLLLRQDRLEEGYELPSVVHLDVEVRSREAEDDAGVVRGQEHRVDVAAQADDRSLEVTHVGDDGAGT